MIGRARASLPFFISAALALAAGWLGWRSVLGAARPLGDEHAYLCAFVAMRKGFDPYLFCPRFFYLPAFAGLGALAERHWASQRYGPSCVDASFAAAPWSR